MTPASGTSSKRLRVLADAAAATAVAGVLLAAGIVPAQAAQLVPDTAVANVSAENTLAQVVEVPVFDWDELASSVQKMAAQAWERTWVGKNLSDLVLVLADSATARLVTREDTSIVSIQELEERNIPIPRDGSYRPARWDERPAIVVNPTKMDPGEWGTANQVFRMATHEAAHFFIQYDPDDAWPAVQRPREEQFTEYPLDARPRVQRAMLHNTLLNAYLDKSNRSAHLAAAAHWWQSWNTEYPGERDRARDYDVIEGTANFMETASVAMGVIDKPDSLDQRRDYLKDVLKPSYQWLSYPDDTFESYKIGEIAGLVLDDLGRDGWKDTVMFGEKTPADLLLETIAPSGWEEAPDEVRLPIEEKIHRRSQETSARVDASLLHVNDARYPLLRLPGPQGGDDGQPIRFPIVGATSLYRSPDVPYDFFDAESGEFDVGSDSLTANMTAVFLDGSQYVLVLEPENIRLEGNRLTVSGDNVSGTLNVSVTHDDSGHTIFTAVP